MKESYEEFFDVDYSQKEIYESNVELDFDDTVTKSSLMYENVVEGTENLEFLNVRDIFDNSKSVFDSSFITSIGDVDFSGRIDKAVTFDSFRVEETYQMKLKRIRRELEELNTIKELPKNDKKKTIFKVQSTEDIDSTELESLMSLLKTVESKQNESQIKNLSSFEPNIDIKPKIIDTSLGTKNTVSHQEIKSLEHRIYRLENLVGMSEFDLDFGNSQNEDFQNIENIINDLERKFKILLDINNNEYSEKVIIGSERNIAKLLNKMETLNKEIIFKNKKMLSSSSFYLENKDKSPVTSENGRNNFVERQEIQKINALFNLLSEFSLGISENNDFNQKNITVKIINGLVKRLQSLNNLYLEYESVMNISKNSNDILSDLRGDLTKWKETLETANKNLLQMTNEIEKLNSIL